MDEDLISVIVPVYGVEKYLDKCIESILSQTYHNLEIILVDDGSPDNCPQMCDDWAKKDGRIKVIHKENGGQGSARNMALNICQGDYICFVDSDDYLEPNYVELLLNACKEHNADIAICKIRTIDENTLKEGDITEFKNASVVSDCDMVIHASNNEKVYSHSPCNKLYSKDIFNHLRFPEIRMCEDSAIYLETFYLAKTIVTAPVFLYNYIIHTGSTMRKDITLERFNSRMKQQEVCINFLQQHGYDGLLRGQIYSCMHSCIGQYIRTKNKDLKKYIKERYKKYRKEYKRYINFWKLPIKLKIKMIYMAIF